MSQRIYFNFINIEDENFFSTTNSKLTITQYNEYGYKTYINEFYIEYFLEKNSLKKKYFIQTFDINPNELFTKNFNIEIINFSYIYAYFNGELNKSIIIYNLNNNYYQFVYLGLPNLKTQVEIQINYDYYYLANTNEIEPIKEFSQDSQIIMMLNNYQGKFNYTQNTILLDSKTYQIYIYPIDGIVDSVNSSINNYKLFKIT